MSTQHIVGRLEIAQRLRSLADDMTEVATLMNYHGGLAEWARHGVELAGAAHVARSWADAIEVPLEGKVRRTWLHNNEAND